MIRKTGGEYAIFLEAYSFQKKNSFVEMLGSMVSFVATPVNLAADWPVPDTSYDLSSSAVTFQRTVSNYYIGTHYHQ
jgi:hypothetical protein